MKSNATYDVQKVLREDPDLLVAAEKLKEESEKPNQTAAERSPQEWGNGRGQGQERLSQVKRLLLLGADAELFHTPEDEPYASVPVDGHVENWSLKSRRFRQWLLGRYYIETQGAPKNQAVQEAIGLFESKANFDGPEYPVFVRFAEQDERIYLDLANDAWEAVEIDPMGWRVVSTVPVKFRRARGMSALPSPIHGDNIDKLQRFVNVASEQDWILIAAWLMAAVRPRGPYPVLILHGEQGSAKSTTARVLRALLDPNTAPLRGEPRDLRDVMIAASNSWIISLDNLSHIQHWLSDALCRLATGGGFSTRELYTDSEEILFDAQRPVILNAIEELATRADLLDRAVILYLPSIPEEKRDSEKNLWSNFEAMRPALLGALLDATSGALHRLPDVRLKKKPRLADFALWATSAERPLGFPDGAFMAAYVQNQSSANDLALEASPIAVVIQALARDEGFEGTATELLRALTIRADEAAKSQKSWPADGRALSNKLRRLASNLRKCGVDISFSREPNRKRNRIITIRELASASSSASDDPNSKISNRRNADAEATNLDASERSADLVNCTDTRQLSGIADDADDLDARTHPSNLLATDVEGKSVRLLRRSEKRRLEGEL